MPADEPPGDGGAAVAEPPTTTTLYIVRHGDRWDYANAATWKARAEELGFQSRDPPLSAIGHEQARSVAAFLADEPIDGLLVSPYLRAIQTAQPLAHAAGVSICIEEGLAETRHTFGLIAGAAQRFPYFPEVDVSYTPVWEVPPQSPDSAGQCEEDFPVGYLGRMVRMAKLLQERFQGQTVVCVTHAAAVGLVAALLQQPLAEVGEFAPAGIFKLSRRGGAAWVLDQHGGDNSGHVTRNNPTTYPWGFMHLRGPGGSPATREVVEGWWRDALSAPNAPPELAAEANAAVALAADAAAAVAADA